MASFMFHKPKGYLTARSDRTRPTIMRFFPAEAQAVLHPVGRLDLDTEGLLLLTDDGMLDHRLLRPEHRVEKIYRWRCFGRLDEDAMQALRRGVELEGLGCRSAPARGRLLGYSTIGENEAMLPAKKHNHLMKNPQRPVTEGLLAVTEGRKHQIKLMIKAVGGHVFALKRLSIGSLVLDPALGPGAFRALRAEEEAVTAQPLQGPDPWPDCAFGPW